MIEQNGGGKSAVATPNGSIQKKKKKGDGCRSWLRHDTWIEWQTITSSSP